MRKNRMKTWLVPMVLLVAGFGVACGGAQRLDPESNPPWSDRLIDAVPADADFMLVRDFDPRDASLIRAEAGRTMAHLSAPATLMLQAVERETGVMVDRDRGLEQFGIDPDGGVVLYVRDMAPTILFRLADDDVFTAFVERIRAANPEATWESWSADGIPFERAMLSEHARLDVGRRGDFGIFRLAMTDAGIRASDEHLRQAVRGIDSGDRLTRTPEGRELLARLGGEEATSMGFVRATFLSSLVTEFMRRAGASYMLGSPTTSADALYGSDERRELCSAEAARLAALMPWSGFAATSGDDPALRRSVAMVRLSPEAEARIAAWLPGAITLTDEILEGAAIAGAGGANLAEIWSDLEGDARFAGCPDLAMVTGLLGFVRSEVDRQVRFNLELFDGRAAVLLRDARIVGLLPMADAAVMIGSPDPPRLLNIFQNRLGRLGATGTLVPDSSITTVEFRVLHLRLRVLQLADRLVMSVGNVPQRTALALANEVPAANAEALSMRWNGEFMRPVVERAHAYLFGSEMIQPELRPTVRDLLQALYATDHAQLSVAREEGALVIRAESRVDAALLAEPLPDPVVDEYHEDDQYDDAAGEESTLEAEDGE